MSKKLRPGCREVFRRRIVRNGRIMYPKKAKVFHLFVKK